MDSEIIKEKKKILEAALFMSSGFASMEKLKETLNSNNSDEILGILLNLKKIF